MFKFDMTLAQNFAIFYDDDNVVLVDSFDNKHFDVRMGTITNSKIIGSVTAQSDTELNVALEKLINSIREQK
ncbi:MULTISPECIES: hypothetical protein [Neisseria]|uniref:hypothetical protein n=1 Tax=Neisseria TaxID=482 RepID=UPI00265A73CD|nr:MULTISPECIES: hypothetical protein [Neisseria]